MKGIPATTQGFWSLWQIGMLTLIQRRQRVLPVFVHDDGRNLQPTARFVWDELNTNPWRLDEAIPSADANFPIQQIVVHGALFPFDMTELSLTALKENPRLDLFRHGMSETLIGLSMDEAARKHFRK